MTDYNPTGTKHELLTGSECAVGSHSWAAGLLSAGSYPCKCGRMRINVVDSDRFEVTDRSAVPTDAEITKAVNER